MDFLTVARRALALLCEQVMVAKSQTSGENSRWGAKRRVHLAEPPNWHRKTRESF